MMKNFKKYTLIACSLFTLAACDLEIDITNPGLITEEKPDRPQAGETITYRAQVWVEKNDMEELYGGERLFRQNLEALFRNTTTFWNESTNKFDYRFEWAMGEGDDNLVIYDIKSGVKSQAEYNVYKDKAYGTLNTEKYDFVLFLALRCTKGGLSCGGGGASKQSVVQAYFEEGHDIFAKKWPEKGTYSDLGHEYGHVRGAQDLYQYMIPAENNPVSHVAYDYPKCNMGTGYQEWSDYCSAIFNHNAQYKQITADMTRSTYPKQMLVRITKDGKPVQRATVNFWGSRATFRDIYAEPGNSPYMKKKTDANGEFTINDIYRMFIPDYNNIIPTKPYTEDILGLPVINIRYVPLSNTFNALIKRSMDIAGAIVAIIVSSPVMLVLCMLIKLTSPGPLIYKQERVGLHNQTFRMYKFRSMEIQKESEEKKAWTVKNDPRVTGIGKFMRHTSLDELPQLFNILKGEMSLVGPRPERPFFVEKFREEIPRYMVKHQVRPGLTGWAQVNGYRGDTSIRKRIECDLYYIENWSVGFDIKIMFLTIFKGFINKNAY